MGNKPAPSSPLGTRYICFVCSARFYDLNRPEPLCPKCGANQDEKPKAPSKPATRAKRKRRKTRGMSPLLDEDDDEIRTPEREEMVEIGLEATLLERREVVEEEESEDP